MEATAVAESQTKSFVVVQHSNEALVWYWLIRLQNSSFGAGEEDLIEKTKLQRGEVCRVLRSLLEVDLVDHRIQQVGTGGSTDHFYRLLGKKFEIGVQYEA